MALVFEGKTQPMLVDLPESWLRVVGEERDQLYVHKLSAFVDGERRRTAVSPPEAEVFNALKLTPYQQVRVVVLGQDPYHEPGQAHGLCFSVRPGVALPLSLKNIFRELRNDLGSPPPNNGCLVPWALQGVLLLNTVLTVRSHTPKSHPGWLRLGAVYQHHYLRHQREGLCSRLRAVGWRRPAQG